MLNEYSESRFVDNTFYTFGTNYIDKVLKSKNFLINSISNLGVLSIENNKFIKDMIIKSATGNE